MGSVHSAQAAGQLPPETLPGPCLLLQTSLSKCSPQPLSCHLCCWYISELSPRAPGSLTDPPPAAWGLPSSLMWVPRQPAPRSLATLCPLCHLEVPCFPQLVSCSVKEIDVRQDSALVPAVPTLFLLTPQGDVPAGFPGSCTSSRLGNPQWFCSLLPLPSPPALTAFRRVQTRRSF